METGPSGERGGDGGALAVAALIRIDARAPAHPRSPNPPFPTVLVADGDRGHDSAQPPRIPVNPNQVASLHTTEVSVE
jgi:hypothetical protein